MNDRDSEIIEQLLAQIGYITVADMNDADLVVLNTCSIRAKAEQKVYSLLGQLRPNKERNPKMRIVVAGCVAQQEGNKLIRKMPHVDIVVGTQQVYRIPELLEAIERGESKRGLALDLSSDFEIPPYQQFAPVVSPTPVNKSTEPQIKKFVTIMQGCNNYCSYCVVPATRGREISRPVRDILEEVQLLISKGVKEVTLLGQNVNSYGKTNQVAEEPVDFAGLLRQVAALEGLKRLRFTTSNPKDLSEELMRCFAELDVLCPHFHLPVQSGSNRVLKLMNRKYTVESYLEKVDTLRSYRPDIALATDIIVGHPGETDEDFEETMELLEKVRFHGSFSFKYSDRPGTRSSEFSDKIDEKVKSTRLARFQKRQDEIGLERNQEFVGTVVEVMVEKVENGDGRGRNPTNHLVHFPANDTLRPGDFVSVAVEHAGKHSLRGIIKK